VPVIGDFLRRVDHRWHPVSTTDRGATLVFPMVGGNDVEQADEAEFALVVSIHRRSRKG